MHVQNTHVQKRIGAVYRGGLCGVSHVDQLVRAVKLIPKGKALGIDAITAEVLEVGENNIQSITLPLYRAILRSGVVPSSGTRQP